MKKTLYYFASVFIFSLLFILLSVNSAYAIQGQLNYDFEKQGTGQVVVKDMTEINTCNSKNAELDTQLKNCQQANKLLKVNNSEKDKKTDFLKIAFGVSVVISLLLGIGLLTILMKLRNYRKSEPTPEPIRIN